MRTSLLFILTLLSVTVFSQTDKELARTRVVYGKINIRDNFKGDTNIKKLTVTLDWFRHQVFQKNLDGQYSFKFDSLNKSFGKLKIKSNYYFKDTTLLIDMLHADTIYIDILFPPVCKYDYSLFNKRCPKCKKEDKVIPIKYGYVNGPADYKDDLKTYKIGGCIIKSCQPHAYCKRDSLDF